MDDVSCSWRVRVGKGRQGSGGSIESVAGDLDLSILKNKT